MRKLYELFVFVVLAALILSACGAPAFEVGSKLICPKNYDPATSKCTVKQSFGDTYDSNTQQELDAVRLDADQVGVYKENSETYGLYQSVGYHPTPKDYVRVYTSTQISIVSDIDPGACGGAYNDYNCVKALDNVTLQGFQKFGASYVLDVTLNFGTQENLKNLYEVGGPAQLMLKFNDRSRDTLRDSADIDPAKYINGELKKPDVAKIWLNKLKTSEYMTSWQHFKLFTFKDLAVRYFEPEKTGSGNSGTTSQVLEDQAFTDFLTKKDLFCAQYPLGSSLRAECDRTFVCSQNANLCYFGSAIIPVDQITPTPRTETTPTP